MDEASEKLIRLEEALSRVQSATMAIEDCLKMFEEEQQDTVGSLIKRIDFVLCSVINNNEKADNGLDRIEIINILISCISKIANEEAVDIMAKENGAGEYYIEETHDYE